MDEMVPTDVRADVHVPAAPRRVLLIAADDRDATTLTERLTAAWPEAEVIRNATHEGAVDRLTEPVECVLLSIAGGGLRERDAAAIRRLRVDAPEIPIVAIVTDEAAGAAAIEVGAQDFLVVNHEDGRGLARVIRHSMQRARAERYWRDLAVLSARSAETARTQRGLIPRPLIDDQRVRTRNEYRPGNRRQVLGGDFFDVVQHSPGQLSIVLGDVCGHGPDEAALGVQLRIAWRTLVLAGVDQRSRLVTLDRVIEQERHALHVYATVASIDVDLATATAHVALAGHPPPILETNGHPQIIGAMPGTPLGIGLPPRWALHPISLGEAWTLLLYSDGIYEGRLSPGGDRLGIDRLFELVAEGGPGAVWKMIPDVLLDHVEELNGGPLEDDVAMLAVRFSGS